MPSSPGDYNLEFFCLDSAFCGKRRQSFCSLIAALESETDMRGCSSVPILVSFWYVASTISPRKNEKARYPGRPVEHYLHFKEEKHRARYHGRAKIPMETFHEMYFDGKVDFKGDALDIMEYRHDWANFRFTFSLFKYFFTGMIPEVIVHSRSQGSRSLMPRKLLLTCYRRGTSS